MTSIQQRRDWIWVAVIAIGITLLSPAVRPVNSAAARDKSLSLSVPAASSVGAEIAIGKRVGRSLRALLQFQQNHRPDRGAWVVYQPVQFVGLVSPLNIVSSYALSHLGYAPATPSLPSSFQRPPPTQIA